MPALQSPVMARHLEMWPVGRLVPYERNARTHSPEQITQVAHSILRFGFTQPILVDEHDGILAGHCRLAAAKQLGLTEVPVIRLDHLTAAERRAYIIADNKLAENAGWDDELLRTELLELRDLDFDLEVVGFSDDELAGLFADTPGQETPAEEAIPTPPAEPVTRQGDLWLIGPHRLICGDCRDAQVVKRLLDGKYANVVITSPPYAQQRAYDPSSGFRPVPEEQYGEWYRPVAANIQAILAADGSYFLNIKEHADEGERSLYVKDLVLAHKRQWGWRFVDEFCWRKTDNGVPGGWGNRLKNAWEPVFHFCRQEKIKFRPKAVGHYSEDCFDYSPLNPESKSGSGLLGTGPRGAAADGGRNQDAWRGTHQNAHVDEDGRHGGIARPSNVIEVKSTSDQGSHSAPFPRQLVEFFLKCFSDEGDLAFDPFLGSGTTIAAAHVLGRVGSGCEISPAYCDVILQRLVNLGCERPVLVGSGKRFAPPLNAQPICNPGFQRVGHDAPHSRRAS